MSVKAASAQKERSRSGERDVYEVGEEGRGKRKKEERKKKERNPNGARGEVCAEKLLESPGQFRNWNTQEEEIMETKRTERGCHQQFGDKAQRRGLVVFPICV